MGACNVGLNDKGISFCIFNSQREAESQLNGKKNKLWTSEKTISRESNLLGYCARLNVLSVVLLGT